MKQPAHRVKVLHYSKKSNRDEMRLNIPLANGDEPTASPCDWGQGLNLAREIDNKPPDLEDAKGQAQTTLLLLLEI